MLWRFWRKFLSLCRRIDWNFWHWLRLPSLGDIRALREANEKARLDSQSLLMQKTDDIRSLLLQKTDELQSLLAEKTKDLSLSLKDILAHCLQTGNNLELANEQVARLAESLQKALQKKTEELSSCLMSSFGKLGEDIAERTQTLARDFGTGSANLESRFDELGIQTKEFEKTLLKEGRAGFERLAKNKDAFEQSASAFFSNGGEALNGLARQVELMGKQIDEFIAIATSLREVFDLFLVNDLIDKLEAPTCKKNETSRRHHLVSQNS